MCRFPTFFLLIRAKIETDSNSEQIYKLAMGLNMVFKKITALNYVLNKKNENSVLALSHHINIKDSLFYSLELTFI